MLFRFWSPGPICRESPPHEIRLPCALKDFLLKHVAVYSEYHGRLLVLSQRFEEACLMLRDAFDVYPQKTAGFRACGQLLQFCAAFMQLNGRLSEPRAKQRAHPQAGRWTSQKSLAKTGSGFSHC